MYACTYVKSIIENIRKEQIYDRTLRIIIYGTVSWERFGENEYIAHYIKVCERHTYVPA